MMVKSAVATATMPQALNQALGTIRKTIPGMGSDRPKIGRPDLSYERNDDDWVDGFWSGQLWLAYVETGDKVFFDAARRQRPYFVERLTRPESHTHDLGFLYSLSAVADYKLTGDAESCRMGLAAAESLARRYNPLGRFIRAWNEPQNEGKIIIDCMENLALLFWAAGETGESRFSDVAVSHATTAAQTLVRPDGSSFHAYKFDPATGKPLGGLTHQGYSDDSCWSRGQGWGIHGFAQTYAYTGELLFLETSQRLADYAIAHLPADAVPYWDYELPEYAPSYRDTSAAAITAAGLLLLTDQLGESERASHYRETAHTILESLIADYTTASEPQAEGLLLKGAAFVEAGLPDAMLPYGDYFYMEALSRAYGRKNFFW